MKRSSLALLLIALVFSFTAVMAQDSSEYVFNPDTGNFYMFVEGAFTWQEANAAALSLGCNSHLVTITSQAETDFIVANGWINNYWIGGFFNADTGAWEWVTGEPFEYTNWEPEQPSGDGSALTITNFEDYSGAQWNDVPEDISGEFIPKGYIVEFNCIINGGFEQNAPNGNRVIPNTEQATTPTDITGWEVIAGSVDWLGPASNVAAADGVQFLDVTSYTPGSISQTFNTVQCATYGVDFSISGITSQEPAQKELSVIAGVTQQTFTFDGADNAWEDRSMIFNAISNTTTLTFTSHVDGTNGPQLDNVRVYPEIVGIGFTQDELADTTWQFARADGTVLGETFILNADGTIGGYENANETYWAVVSGRLVIYSADSVASTCFTNTTTENGVLTLNGEFLLNPERQIIHVLRRVS